MKKELVILAGNCFPICSATGSIAINFAKYLMSEYHISMIVLEQEGYHYDKTQIDGIDVYSITNWRLKWAQKSKIRRDTSKGGASRIYNLSFQTARIIGRIQATFFTINNNAWYAKRAYNVLKRIYETHPIDAILTCAAPHEAHYAGFKFKSNYPSVRWVTYWGDLLANKTNKLNIFISMRKLREIEKKLSNAADFVMTTEENYTILKSELVKHERIKALPYLLNQVVLDSYYDNAEASNEGIKIVYMGAFYKEIRNPEYFLSLFSNIDCDFTVMLFSSGNCESIVEKYVRKSKGKIRSMGQVPKEQLVAELRSASFLVNIENKLANSNPSKLLELISYGKPIIDFSYSDEVCDTLLNYPYKLNINMNVSIENNMKIVENFIQSNNNKRAELQTIKATYRNNLESNIKTIVLDAFRGGD